MNLVCVVRGAYYSNDLSLSAVYVLTQVEVSPYGIHMPRPPGMGRPCVHA